MGNTEERQRSPKNTQNIANNPHITSGFFLERAERLFKSVYGDAIKDIWYILEWQSRGSIHLQGLMWMNDVPNLPTPDKLLTAKRELENELEMGRLSTEGARGLRELNGMLQEWSGYFDNYCGAVDEAIIPEQEKGLRIMTIFINGDRRSKIFLDSNVILAP